MRNTPPLTCERGVALLLFMFLVFGIGTTIFLTTWNNSRVRLEHDQKTELALQQAKEALIAFATTHKSLPGRLPCPEDTSLIGTANEGNEQGSCSNSSTVVGRLPWRSLGLNKPVDADGESLWYVRSPGFQSKPINSDSTGKIQLDGLANAAVALVIAPGTPLSGQIRPTPTGLSPPDAQQYLDLGNANGTSHQSSGPIGTFNDRVLAITRDQLLGAVEQRVVREVRNALQDYYDANGYFPAPAMFSDTSCLGKANNNSGCINSVAACDSTICRGRIPANPGGAAVNWSTSPLSVLRGTTGIAPDWFQANGWRELIFYAVAASCAETASGCTGNIQIQNSPMLALSSLRTVVIAAGPALLGQSRNSSIDKANVLNYLEDKNALPPYNIFATASPLATTPFNDRPAWIP